MRSFFRAALFLAGLLLFGWFLHRAGPREIFSAFTRLGWLAPMVLLPYALVYLADTLGWHFAFGQERQHGLRFWRLVKIRWAGEALNSVVPSAYIGGEALKVRLLTKHGVPGVNGAASVVTGKTVQTVGQLFFLALAALALLQLTQAGSRARLAAVLGTGAIMLALAALFFLQRHGFFSLALRVIEKLRVPIPVPTGSRQKLREIDDRILQFYRESRKHFLLSLGAYLAGWLLGVLEVAVIAALLGVPLHWTHAVVLEAFVGVGKIFAVVVPGALGVQETGILVLCRAVGLSDAFAMNYAILRRGREVVFALIGGLTIYFEELTLKDLKRGLNVTAQK